MLHYIKDIRIFLLMLLYTPMSPSRTQNGCRTNNKNQKKKLGCGHFPRRRQRRQRMDYFSHTIIHPNIN